MSAQAKKKPPAPPAKPKQTELALTYSVGDWVWVKAHGINLRRMLARIESATPIGDPTHRVWLVRCYYSPQRRSLGGQWRGAIAGWSTTVEHRRVECALNPGEVANLRNQGVIPHAGSSVLP